MPREHSSQLHQHRVKLNCLNGWVEASHAPTMIFPAVFPMFVAHTRKNDTLNDRKASELLKASLYLLLDTRTCQSGTAAPSPESGPGAQCRAEETAPKRAA